MAKNGPDAGILPWTPEEVVVSSVIAVEGAGVAFGAVSAAISGSVSSGHFPSDTPKTLSRSSSASRSVYLYSASQDGNPKSYPQNQGNSFAYNFRG